MNRDQTASGATEGTNTRIAVVAMASLAFGALVGNAVAGAFAPRGEFHGRRVAVLGGSHGRGFKQAMRLARKGARVAILSPDFNELAAARDRIAREGGEVFAVPCDLTQARDVQNAINNVMRRFGGVDMVIARA